MQTARVLPNTWCNIETFSHAFLTLGNFLAFFLYFSSIFTCVFDIKNASEECEKKIKAQEKNQKHKS